MDTTQHPSPRHHHSSTLEKALEYKLLGELLAELLRRGILDTEVFRPDVDQAGWDVGLEVHAITRHTQLKSRVRGGKRDRLSLNVKLARKPSGCVIWFDYDPLTLALGPFRWFGGEPGQPLPALGDKVARHTKGNKDGVKALRQGHRVVGESSFDELASIEEVVERLFGPAANPKRVRPIDGQVPGTNASAREQAHRDFLVRHLQARAAEEDLRVIDEPAWLEEVRQGRFENLPEQLSPDEMRTVAHLVNGYDLALDAGLGDLQEVYTAIREHAARIGAWSGTALELWLVIFGEHRRARQSAHGGEDQHLLETAYAALRARLHGRAPEA